MIDADERVSPELRIEIERVVANDDCTMVYAVPRAGLVHGMLRGLACVVRMCLLRAGFLDGKAGVLLALRSAHSTFVKYADLWIRQQRLPRTQEDSDARGR